MNQNTEQIEKFLSGELTVEETKAFEERLVLDAVLREELELQKEIIGGMERIALKEEIQTAFKKVRFYKMLKLGGIMGVCVIGVLAFVYFNTKKPVEFVQQVPVAEFSGAAPVSKTSPTVITAVQQSPNPRVSENSAADSSMNVIKKTAPPKLMNANKIIFGNKTEVKKVDAQFKIPSAFLPPVKLFMIWPKRDTLVKLSAAGTVLRVPANAFVDAQGKAVSDTVAISFREYTNAAEIAFSGIPMTYKEKDVEYNFNSAGMFEINGEVKGEPVALKTEMQIDYQLANKIPDIDFYYLDKNKNEWVKKQEIEIPKKDSVIPKKKAVANQLAYNPGVAKQDSIRRSHIDKHRNDGTWPKTDRECMKLQEKYGNNWEMKLLYPSQYDTIKNLKKNVTDQQLVFLTKGTLKLPSNKQDSAFYKKNLGENWSSILRNREPLLKEFNLKVASTPLAVNGTGSFVGDVSTTMTEEQKKLLELNATLARGLKLSRFGTYNCDQTYRILNPVYVNARFLDKAGNIITDRSHLSLVDHAVNAAFYFGSYGFTCNQKGENTLLLFTQKGKLYGCSKTEFRALNIAGNGTYDFVMTDLTDQVRSAEDVKKYLGL
jgi:hypothetical protein